MRDLVIEPWCNVFVSCSRDEMGAVLNRIKLSHCELLLLCDIIMKVMTCKK